MEEVNSDKAKVTVELIENGPMRITGNFNLKDLKRDFEDNPQVIELCRCGRSANKPYCDGAHEKP